MMCQMAPVSLYISLEPLYRIGTLIVSQQFIMDREWIDHSCTCLPFFSQITFFAGCMALSGRREEENRHGWTFQKVVPKSQAGRFYYTNKV